MTDLPTGTLTFLLTDVEASTALWDTDPETAADTIAKHEAIIERAVTDAGGRFVKSRGEGDSTFSVFRRATDGVVAALEIQRTLVKSSPLRVRAALHTGEAELRDGDYYGTTVNRCARLRKVAHGRQVLLSRTTHDVACDALPEDVILVDLGPSRLRDLQRPEHVFQLAHPDLERSFPPLRSLETLPNNLPAQLTSFVGREDDIATVRTLLGSDRLVTLTGSGGCGKTRLAIQTAADALEGYPDGAWFVDLGPLSDPALVPNAVGDPLGIRELPNEPMTKTLGRLLASRRSLVVLDNCEHVIDACADLVDYLLRSCPDLAVLATSREPLGVQGETTWKVPSLDVPGNADDLEAVIASAAVQLFAERAVKARPTFAVDAVSAAAVVQICRRLDGIPLAIELAASRIRVTTSEQIALGLDDRFRILGTGGRTTSSRQRTLDASVDWSYNLLTDEQRTLLGRLSVFAGTFALDSAEEVCAGGDIDGVQVFDLLVQLVDRSLVQVEEEGGPRYRLLETIRQYARLKLGEAGEADAVRSRHLEHYIDLMNRARPMIEFRETKTWLERIHRERDNLRAAMDWSLDSGQAAGGLCLATTWPEYWLFSGHLEEGKNRVNALREAARPQRSLLARALVTIAAIAARRGDTTNQSIAAEAVEVAREADDLFAESRAWLHGGAMRAMLATGDPKASYAVAIDTARRAGDRWAAHTATSELAVVLMSLGMPGGREMVAETVATSRASGDLLNLGLALGIHGSYLFLSGHLGEAERELTEAVDVGHSVGDRYWTRSLQGTLAKARTSRGDYESPRRLAEGLLAESRDSGHIQGFAFAWDALIHLAFVIGDADAASAATEAGAPFLRAAGFGILAAPSFAVGAWAAAERDEHDLADRFLDEATTQTLFAAPLVPFVALVKALLARRAGAIDIAERELRNALGKGLFAPAVLEALGGVFAVTHADEEAARVFGAADAVRRGTGSVRWPSQAALFDADLAVVRDALGKEHFSRCWADGARLSIDEAIAYIERGRGERKRPASGWESLTPTELEVTDLVASGLSNPQIAEKMFISRRTVTTHLTHIFNKLGISSRTELTAEATRRGISA